MAAERTEAETGLSVDGEPSEPAEDRPDLPIVGLIEIAQAAGVKRPVVSMWRTRYIDFPMPVKELAVGPVFWWPEVAAWLKRTGRATDANWDRIATRSNWDSQSFLTGARKYIQRMEGEGTT